MILSLDPRLEPGTDFEGSLSVFPWFWDTKTCSEGGEVSCEPERLLRLFSPGGETKLEDEKRLGRGNPEEKTWSRYSGGVVGSL